MNKKVINNFTPGPWDIHSGARGLEIHPADDEHGENPIADILTNEADARLIAAAPALLAALESMISMENWAGDDIAPDSTLGRALAAIAQARGA